MSDHQITKDRRHGLPTSIEDQLRMTVAEAISKGMNEVHQALPGMIDTAVAGSVQKYVNGKIDSFRADQTKVNDAQNLSLQSIEGKIEDMFSLYDGSGKFFRATRTIALWVTSVTVAGTAVWAFVKFVVKSALIK